MDTTQPTKETLLDGFKTLTKMETTLGSYSRRSHIMVDRRLVYPPTVKVPLWNDNLHVRLMTPDTLDLPMKTYYAVYLLGADNGGKYLWYNYKGEEPR